MPKCAVYLDMRDNRWWRTGRHIPEQAELDGSVTEAFILFLEHIGVAPLSQVQRRADRRGKTRTVICRS